MLEGLLGADRHYYPTLREYYHLHDDGAFDFKWICYLNTHNDGQAKMDVTER